MILHINGEISRYYAESLALLFFPGSKFPEDSSLDTDNISVWISAEFTDNTARGKVVIKGEAGEVCGEYTVPDSVAADKSRDMKLKLAAGGAMLAAGERYTGSCPPWGMLTGVRPAKTAAQYLCRGLDTEQTAQIMRETYLVKDAKARLAAATAENELKYINGKARRECSIYIAIPFCPSKCSYCSFVSFTSPRLLSLIPRYLEALTEDIRNISSLVSSLGIRVSTVYIGGGTPTVLSTEQLTSLLSAVGDSFNVSQLDEFTLEAGRPDTITREKLRAAHTAGVTRVSVNPQTLNDSVLERIGRRHTAEDFFRAYETARESGIRDINVDLIAGLPGDTEESFDRTLRKTAELGPRNITVHTFYAKRAAELVKSSRDVFRITDEVVSAQTDLSQSYLPSLGYRPYYMYRQKNTAANLENVGYALPGHESIYNIMMMEEIHTVFGVGASAMTKLVSPDTESMKIIRISEPKYPYEYLSGREEGNKRHEELRSRSEEFYRQYFKK